MQHCSSTAAPQPATGSTGSANDGTNYVTTNISIFPATECRPEHREYLQHDGNLCAGYGAAKNRSIDVDFSGSPLICDKLQSDGKIYRTVQGLLTWSTDINHAPHLFTNLTTYREWIDREIEKLDGEPQTSQRPIVAQTVSGYPNRSPILYG
uniref:Peptidase S1 domain-containing protein n=1 Tax=Anopheles culicifacies TaxID=139723 RepID=A0A182MUJ1_9DIPT